MTTDLKPWLHDESASSELKSLLESAEVDEPTEAELERLTGRIAFLFDVPPGGGPDGDGGGGGGQPSGLEGGATSGGATAVATKVATGVSAKLFIGAVVASGGLVTGAFVLRPKPEPAPVVAAVAQAVKPVEIAPPPVEPVAEPAPAVVEPPKPAPAKPRVVQTTPPPQPPSPPAPTAPTSDEELSLLDSAMASSRSGNASQALAAVDAHRAKFPQSPLAQEREVIAIDSLVLLGRPDDARARLAAFRSRWPTSTHLLRLEALLP